ncbi:hypothetical protein ACWC6I_32565 [Streptomyces sp. NPDC001414]
MTAAAPTPAALPPHVLERADVRSAIANHDFGEVFRLAKIHGNVSYAKISEAVGYKREHIGKTARQETDGMGARPRITQFHKIIEVVDGLRIPHPSGRALPASMGAGEVGQDHSDGWPKHPDHTRRCWHVGHR